MYGCFANMHIYVLQQTRSSGLLELELHRWLLAVTWVLQIQARATGKATRVLNYWAIFPGPVLG